MGGLVIKRAYILAEQFQEYELVAQRIKAMFFLGTPHRGSDLATILTKILHFTSGASRGSFVQDLHPNSLATQSINDEFPRHCHNLLLYSFYETIPTNYGFGKGLIVEKDMAVLGYSNERTGYVDANHRDICKFYTQNDPNYLTIRNALATVVNEFRDHLSHSRRDFDKEKRQLLDNYLNASDAPEDDLMAVDARRLRGSCRWLTQKESFTEWRDQKGHGPSLYWISAKPASGKSVLSSYIVKHLRELGRDCAFHFFNHADKLKASITVFLRSMAWQMAVMHPEVLRKVLETCEKTEELARADYRTVWRKLFLDGIMSAKLDRPQYWVVDALDECKNDSELVPLLLKVAELWQVRIIVTSRYRFEAHRHAQQSKTKVYSDEIMEKDSKLDIALYLEVHMDSLPSVDEEARQNMVKKILTKSAGCFLWVSLVLQELTQVHTSAEISQVLEDVPSDMDALYLRILNSMSEAAYGKLLAKSILTWIVCSARTLTTEELYEALKMDIKDKVDRIEKSIAACCGQLVYVDSQKRVHLIHQTARDFLLRSTIDSEFTINKRQGHRRLGMTCLHYLSGDEMKGPRYRKLSAGNLNKPRSVFAKYACSSLFEHMAHISSEDDDFLATLARFLSSPNVLSWIEALAQYSDLNCMIQTGQTFKKYLQRRSRYVSPFGKDVAILDSWATDIVRLATKFGKNLLSSPSSIHHLIPPFCPLESAPRTQFAVSSRGITVVGLSGATWDDCLCTIINPEDQFTAMTGSGKHFALGLASGKIVVYHEMTCQEAQILQQQEPVKFLQFGQLGDTLASAGTTAVWIWDVTSWQLVYKLDIVQACMSIAFTDDDKILLAALRNNDLMIWDLTDGSVAEIANWTEDLDGVQSNVFRRPVAAAICADASLLAVVYRGQDILLWDIERNVVYATYGKDNGPQFGRRAPKSFVTGGLVFSQDPNAGLLAAAYSDGELVLFNTFEGTILERVLANAQTLASSPDGRTLAAADATGTIQIFDFETLKLLYRIKSEDYVKALVFSGNGRHLLDIRAAECRVWDPPILVRQDLDEEVSDTVSISTMPQEVSMEPSEDVVLITSLECDESSDIFFCGKHDGTVHLYDTKHGISKKTLFSHARGVSIIQLFFNSRHRILASIDSSSRVLGHKIVWQDGVWNAMKTQFDYRAGTAVEQFLSNHDFTRVLIGTAGEDILFSLTNDDYTISKRLPRDDQYRFRWTNHPLNLDRLVQLLPESIHIYCWLNLERETGAEGILLEQSMVPESVIRGVTSCASDSLLVAIISNASKHKNTSMSKIMLFEVSKLSADAKMIAPVPKYEYLNNKSHILIGTYGQRLIFLQNQTGWICSADLDDLDEGEHYDRHFFLPGDWLSAASSTDLMLQVTSEGHIIFVKRDEVAVIRRGLETSEQRPSNSKNGRSSFSGAIPRSPVRRARGITKFSSSPSVETKKLYEL